MRQEPAKKVWREIDKLAVVLHQPIRSQGVVASLKREVSTNKKQARTQRVWVDAISMSNRNSKSNEKTLKRENWLARASRECTVIIVHCDEYRGYETESCWQLEHL